jgi:hypothetical protein
VEGLPQSPGLLGLAMTAIGLLAALAYFLWIRRRFPTRSTLAIAAIAAIALAPAPYVTWRIVEDVRYTSDLDPWLSSRYGVSVFHVHPAIFDAAASHMPPSARYYLAVAPGVDSTTSGAFEQWAAGWLLPRVAVSSPKQARWILTLGVDPATVDPAVSRTWRLWPPLGDTPAAYLGEVPN